MIKKKIKPYKTALRGIPSTQHDVFETVEVPVQWFVRMLEVKALAEAQIKEKNVSPEGLMWLVHLLGYLQSAEGYIKKDDI